MATKLMCTMMLVVAGLATISATPVSPKNNTVVRTTRQSLCNYMYLPDTRVLFC